MAGPAAGDARQHVRGVRRGHHCLYGAGHYPRLGAVFRRAGCGAQCRSVRHDAGSPVPVLAGGSIRQAGGRQRDPADCGSDHQRCGLHRYRRGVGDPARCGGIGTGRIDRQPARTGGRVQSPSPPYSDRGRADGRRLDRRSAGRFHLRRRDRRIRLASHLFLHRGIDRDPGNRDLSAGARDRVLCDQMATGWRAGAGQSHPDVSRSGAHRYPAAGRCQ